MNNTVISIHIVNYNNRNLLNNCINTIYHYAGNIAFSITVIDNASTDGSVEMLQTSYPNVKIIENPSNYGFAKAHNIGFGLVDTKYLLLLNPDTLFIDNSIEKMASYMENNEKTGILGPAVLNADRSAQYTGVTFPRNTNFLYETLFLDRILPRSRIFGNHKKIYDNHITARNVDYLQGSCLMIRKELLQDVGCFDENYFLYFEETDYCYRAVQKGWKVTQLHESSIIHYGGGETGYYDEFRTYHYFKSMLFFYKKHYTGANVLILKVLLVLRNSFRSALWFFAGILLPKKRKESHNRIKGYLKACKLILE